MPRPSPSFVKAAGRRPLATMSQRTQSLFRMQTRAPRRTFILRRRPPTVTQTLNHDMDVQNLLKKQYKYNQSRLAFLSAACLASAIWACVSIYRLYHVLQENKQEANQQAEEEHVRKNKTSGVGGAFSSSGKGSGNASGSGKIQADSHPDSVPVPVGSKVVIHNPDGADLVPTGHRTVPHFPRKIILPGNANTTSDGTVEYTLVGLGVRTVSFLQLPVYVVGLYIATQDIAGIQERLVKRVNPLASTLVPSERKDLRKRLDEPPPAGNELWEEALFPARTALRITPVRNTDFPHLRDGFVRAITARKDPQETKDQRFGEVMRDFKHSFNRGKLSQSSELLLQRDAMGKLLMSYVEAKGSGKRVLMGEIEDPRISRFLWLNYLTGSVASPPARESIVQGMMDFVERPIGTVAAQVV
ncbi:chalcone-flavanone isomerase [Zalerion maritima]|uniref:Chalcone-flavanone isomerase n=1 Tax=Zalerion maritima TaxID=339359 RepID=A0AAD5RUI2_9PEZI|nr:chalcone-flavanone isomerase [Zalerion maritima]